MRYKGFEPLSTIIYKIRKFKTLRSVLDSRRQPPRKIEDPFPVDNTISYADKVYEDKFINRELYDTPDISYNSESFYQLQPEPQPDIMHEIQTPVEMELADRLSYDEHMDDELEGLEQMLNQDIAQELDQELNQLEQELYDELMQEEIDELLNNPFSLLR